MGCRYRFLVPPALPGNFEAHYRATEEMAVCRKGKVAPDHKPSAARSEPRSGGLLVYCVSITWVLERVFGNGTPRNDGLVDEVVRKITDLASMVRVIWTPVPAARCAAQGVVVEPPAAVQAIATAIPSAGGEDPHTTPACAIFPIYAG